MTRKVVMRALLASSTIYILLIRESTMRYSLSSLSIGIFVPLKEIANLLHLDPGEVYTISCASIKKDISEIFWSWIPIKRQGEAIVPSLIDPTFETFLESKLSHLGIGERSWFSHVLSPASEAAIKSMLFARSITSIVSPLPRLLAGIVDPLTGDLAEGDKHRILVPLKLSKVSVRY